MAAADRDGPEALEVRERTVHGNARGADERREIVLRQLDLVTLVRRREIEKALRDAARYVEEHEVFDPAGGAADRASEQSEDLPDRARASLDDPEKVVTRDRHNLRLAKCGDRGRPRGIVDDRELAEHRAAARAPENPIASLARGMRDGAGEVEFDVQRTKDGVAVLLHDETLDRTTSGRGPLRDRTLSEIRVLDAGSWFAPEFSGERLPSLADVCAWATAAGADLSVELKQPAPGEGRAMDDGLAESAVAELRASGLLERAVVHSFDHPTIARVRHVAPDARAALLYTGPNLVDPLAF